MKRFLTLLFTTLLLTAALCVSASASSYDAVAEDLSAIGMFQGTANGFELDRAPTRSEAAIMLVRLYGAEEKAAAAYEAGEISHPFTDVSEFTSPYVAWLYTNGITAGYTETTFASSRPCTAQNYVVFLLRALGYKDGVDFEYADAPMFAMTHGLFETSMLGMGGEFLRDDLAAVTYQALGCQLADGSTYLLDSRIKSGAIEAKAAKPITDKITAYSALSDASAAAVQDSLDADFEMDMDMTMTMKGTNGGVAMDESAAMKLSATGGIQMILAEALEMGMKLDMNMAMTMPDPETGANVTVDMPATMGMWLKDDWVYVDESGTRYKQDLGGSMDEFMVVYQEMMTQLGDLTGASAAMSLPYIDTITTAKKGSDTVYTLTFDDKAMMGLVDDIVGLVGGALGEAGSLFGLDISLEDTVCTYVVGRNGTLKDSTVDMMMVMNMEVSEDAANTVAVAINADVNMTMKVNATGSKVKVDYPDLTQFPNIDEIQITPEEAADILGS